MRSFIIIMLLLTSRLAIGQDSLFFDSEKAMANYAYQNTNFSAYTIRFFKDRMFDYNDSVFDFYTSSSVDKNVFGYHAFQLAKHTENWDVLEQTSADSLLHPVMSRLFSLDGSSDFHIPLFIFDLDVHELKRDVREDFEENTLEDPLRELTSDDWNQQRISLACLPLDTLNYPHLWIDLDERFITQNTNREVEYVVISDGNASITVYLGQSVDISKTFRNGVQLTFEVFFSDDTDISCKQQVNFFYKTDGLSEEKSLNLSFTSIIEQRYPFGNTPISEEHPVGKFSVSYSCPDKVLRKPYLMIAGWGPYTDINLLNNAQEWPTPMWKMALQMNQAGLIENLNEQGFDVVILQIFPPNASIMGNAVVIEDVINVLNQRAAQNGHHEELIVQGYSAGALGARLALQMMEKKHLEQNGPHPHTRLFVSFDGEHLGANLPLGIQQAVQYLWDYERWGVLPTQYLRIYGLRYILNAPQSRQLLVHWHETMDNAGNVGYDDKRGDYLAYQFSQDHALTDASRSGFPTFLRNISISNGTSVPDYTFNNNYAADHEPFPSQTGRLIFEDAIGRHRSKIRFSSHGFHEVFLYRRRTWGNWTVRMRGVLNNQLVLDNAPGGMMFIRENPLNAALKIMDEETAWEASTLEYTNFCFTPTVFTHNIHNYQTQTVNGYINYNLKAEGLMYRTPEDVITGDPDINFGYPHLAYDDHFLITPFEAVFSCTEITEHLRIDRQQNSNNPDGPEDFYGVPSTVNKDNYKNFVVDEAEGYNLFLQNKRIGYYARPNYPYYVDYTSLNGIYLGQQVTNKTNFQPLTVENNAHVNAMAGVEINLKPGVHIKNGADVYLHIGELECVKAGFSNEATNSSDNAASSTFTRPFKAEESKSQVLLYPNPSTTEFSVRFGSAINDTRVEIRVLSITGVELVQKIVTLGESIKHDLPKGSYIVHIKIEGLWQSEMLLVD